MPADSALLVPNRLAALLTTAAHRHEFVSNSQTLKK
jgi:hypothetical protein